MTVGLLFLVAVAVLWAVIAYQLVLTAAGFTLWRSSLRASVPDDGEVEWPTLSVLIPAHNEERVIEATLEALAAQSYPEGRFEVLVINDGSTDRTAELVAKVAKRHPQVRLLDIPAGRGGRGKSAALNVGLAQTESELVAVYDADNTPEPHALRILVHELMAQPELGAAIGKFRTVNRSRNLLTRCINLETIAFQWIVQAGRWVLCRVATLPGTNYVIRRHLLEELGGWDEGAIAEDSEMSMRIYEMGGLIKFVPTAVTWEQEPETLEVWLRQRTRWARGNNYVFAKFLERRDRFVSRRTRFEMGVFLSLFYVFFGAVVISDLLFVASLMDLARVSFTGPFDLVFASALVLFVLELMLVASFEGERGPRVVLLALVMYFTYCQLWIWVVTRALFEDLVLRRKHVWHKTPRFARDRAA